MEEPCTNRMVPRGGAPERAFSHRNSFWPSTVVQCSRPVLMVWLMFIVAFPDLLARPAARVPTIGFPISPDNS